MRLALKRMLIAAAFAAATWPALAAAQPHWPGYGPGHGGTVPHADRPRFRDLPPEQRREIARERFQSLPPEEQAQIRQRFREAREQAGGRPLTPEERQQLRRDIREHGRDLYGRP